MARIALVSPDTDKEIRDSLKKLDYDPVPVPRTSLVDERIAGHPDIQLCYAWGVLFCHPGMPPPFLKKISRHADVRVCATGLGPCYPADVPYNVAFTGSHAFHLASATDGVIKQFLSDRGAPLLNVRQGYAKCATMIVDRTRLVTSDESIHRAARSAGLDTLLISPGFVDLTGFGYGFIGGAAGHDEHHVVLSGSIRHHPDHDRIMEFIARAGKKAVVLSTKRIVDLGTIFLIGGR